MFLALENVNLTDFVFALYPFILFLSLFEFDVKKRILNKTWLWTRKALYCINEKKNQLVHQRNKPIRKTLNFKMFECIMFASVSLYSRRCFNLERSKYTMFGNN